MTVFVEKIPIIAKFLKPIFIFSRLYIYVFFTCKLIIYKFNPKATSCW